MSRVLTALSLVVASLALAVAGAGAVVSPITAVDVVHGGMYSSAGWNDIAADYINMGDWAGKDATFAGTFHDVFESEGGNWAGNTAWLLESVWQGHATPMANVTLNASAAAIASGSYDNDIRKWMQRVKAWVDDGGNRSLFIAPLQEHNGTWAPYGCDPVNFRAAYARIRSIGISEGLDETKVRWVWAPNGWTSTTGACAGTSLVDYYPGADIVDVIGFSAYRWTTEDVYAAVGGTAAELRNFAPEKPYVALQTAAGPSASRDQWIRELFQWAADDPNMIGLVWFNIIKERDWRVWAAPSGPGLSSGWRDAMSYSTTHYQWPLTDWFQPGDLPFSVDLGPLSDRLFGSNRYSTSVAVSAATFPSGVPVAYVATGLSFPDALAAAAAGGAQGGPVLLVDGQSVGPATNAELQRLDPGRIVVVGGQNAVSDSVVSALQQIATTERIGGANRFATASMIALDAFDTGVPIAYVATGYNFPDALAAAAAAGAQGGPVLLTGPTTLPAATQSALASLNPDQIVVVGGTAAVSDAVKAQLATIAPTTRIAGSNRYATAAALGGFNPSPSEVFVATGLSFPDALSGAAAAGYLGAPLVLTEKWTVPGPTINFVASASPSRVTVLGGTGVVSDTVSRALRAAAGY